METLLRALLLVAPLAVAATALAAQSSAIDGMLADRLGGRPDAGIVVGTTDGHASNVFARGKAALDANAVFDIGGLSEVFVAVALADMIAKREMDLRDPAGKYLRGVAFPSHGGKSITLEDLVMHRSGLPRTLPGLSRAEAGGLAAYTPERLADFLGRFEPTRDIGAKYERSQVGIAVLAAAMAARAATSLDMLLQERVFGPLELTATRMTAGALRSTAKDVLTFVAANLQADGPMAEILDSTRSSRGNVGAPAEGLGLGWRIRNIGRRQILWSSGAAGGHQAFMAVDPAERRGVVVLHNQSLSVNDIGFSILEDQRESATRVDPAFLAAFAGEYEIKRGLMIVVRLEGRKLAIRVGEEPESTLTQDSDVRFVVDDADARITFIRDASGTPIGLMLHRGGQHIAARKLR